MDEKNAAIAHSVNIPTPVFTVGVSKVRWKPLSSSDWGLVMGMRYRWAEHKCKFEWQYYVVLDNDSPSSQWTSFDWAWQDDLEILPDSFSITSEKLTENDQ
jgi:hypothetical protein